MRWLQKWLQILWHVYLKKWGLCPILLDLGEDVNDLTNILQRK